MCAAALTCQTLAPRPQARAQPGRLPSRGTRSRPPPELRAPRVTGGTEAGKAATGPEREEAYIGGAGKATPRSSFLSGSRPRFPGTASRQPPSAAPGPSPEAPPRRQPGFRQPHSAHSGQGLRHLDGGGKRAVRTRYGRGGQASRCSGPRDWTAQPQGLVPCLCGLVSPFCSLHRES